MNSVSDIPEFVREADEREVNAALPVLEPQLLDVLGLLPSLLAEPHVRGRERLVRAVEDWSERYAPFFARLGELWDLPAAEVQSVFERARDPAAWQRLGLRGVSAIAVAPGPRVSGADCRLVRFAAGTRFPAHRHVGAETVLVLEGSYLDVDGRRYAPGDVQVMEAGTEHRLRIDDAGDCVAATVLHGLEFTGPALRWLSRLFRRS